MEKAENLTSRIKPSTSVVKPTCPYHWKRISHNFSTLGAYLFPTLSYHIDRHWSNAKSLSSLPRGTLHCILQSASSRDQRRWQGRLGCGKLELRRSLMCRPQWTSFFSLCGNKLIVWVIIVSLIANYCGSHMNSSPFSHSKLNKEISENIYKIMATTLDTTPDFQL